MTLLNKKSKDRPTAADLSAEHSHLEQWFLDLTARAASGDHRECDAVWSAFAEQLESHMAFEEREIFPRYIQRGAAEAEIVRNLMEEHKAIRAQMETMGLELQLHLTSAKAISSFLDKLREHARREQETLYPWLEANKAAGPSHPATVSAL